MSVIHTAELIAKNAHQGVMRKYTGQPYFTHVERVAKRLAEFGDEDLTAAGYLHDVFEDCGPEWREMVARECGPEVFVLVCQVTNPSKGLNAKRSVRKEIDRLHLIHASPEAMMLKLVDRTDNLRDMVGADSDFKELYLQESRALLGILHGVHYGLEQDYVAAMEYLRSTIKE